MVDLLCYRVIHLFFTKQADHVHCFDIGIYDDRARAQEAIDTLKTKVGFNLRPNKFYVIPVLRFKKPKLLNRTYWDEGFTTYTYTK